MEILFYTTPNGKSPIKSFIDEMTVSDKAKVLGCLKSIEELGFDTPRVEFRQIEGKLWEIKIRTKAAGYRFFYIILRKSKLVVLHAYKKQSQKAPIKEIEIATNRQKEIEKNEANYFE